MTADLAAREPDPPHHALCVVCGYRRLVIRRKDNTIRLRPHDMRRPVAAVEVLRLPKLDPCPGSGAVVTSSQPL